MAEYTYSAASGGLRYRFSASHHHLRRVVTISVRCGMPPSSGSSPVEPDCQEGQIIQRFFDGIVRFTPQLVSWR